MKKIFTFAFLALTALSTWADNGTKQTLWTSPESSTSISTENPSYRIPSIVKTKSGMLVAICDERRTTSGADIGYGRIDLVYKTSTDNGKTWSAQKTLAQGTTSCAYGDAAAVCDSETGEILIMCTGGKVNYEDSYTRQTLHDANADDAIRIFRITGTENGSDVTWSAPTDMSESIYGLYYYRDPLSLNRRFCRIEKGFFSSGSLCQSTLTKNGSHYRIYGVLRTDLGSQVVYTDDLGETWSLQAAYDAPNGATYGS